jgi:hypothetical protein
MAEIAAPKQPLDEVMLAMDVVDTLRHRQLLVERELASDERDQRMLERLRQIYASQGLEVPEHVLEEGVRALHEKRFVYEPRSGGVSLGLARLYVERGKWLRRAGIGVASLALIGAVYLVAVVWPQQRESQALGMLAQDAESARTRLAQSIEDAELRQGGERIHGRLRAALDAGDQEKAAAAFKDLNTFLGMPKALIAARDGAVAAATVPEAASQARASYADGMAALKAGDTNRADAALDRLEKLRARLSESYRLRIVSDPGERSGVWRVSAANPNSRNYYIIVDAIDAGGAPVKVSITSEEDGRNSQVTRWGIRVDEGTFNRIRTDKEDDGIIQANNFGAKERGQLEYTYRYPTTGGAITSW